MGERVKVRTSTGERRLSRSEILIRKMIELASKGNIKAMQQLFSWLQQATPDEPAKADQQNAALSPADELTLAAFRDLVAAELSNSANVNGGSAK
jgi:hypothetical protein